MSKLIVLDREIELIKGLFAHTSFNIQQVQSIFSYLERNINTRDIGAIKRGSKPRYKKAKAASEVEIKSLLVQYSKVTIAAKKVGLLPKNQDTDMILKAIEIMKSAILIYNNNNISSRSESFIVLAVIAWTYALHTFYRKRDIRPVHVDEDGNDVLYDGTHPKYWELSTCLAHAGCPLSDGAKRNLKYIIEIRNEVEHRTNENINEGIQAKIQATALNFVKFCTENFGAEYNFSEDLAFTIQLTKLTLQSENTIKNDPGITKSVAAVNAMFETNLTTEEYNDPEYAYRVHVVPKTVNNPQKADEAVTFSPPGSKIEMAIKNVERPKFLMKEVIPIVKEKGFPDFNRAQFIELFNENDLKNPGKGLAIQLGNSWFWYQEGIDRIVELLGTTN